MLANNSKDLTHKYKKIHLVKQQGLQQGKSIAHLKIRPSWTKNVNLVLLVSCPRSGTTWLQVMLASHPAIYTGPETHFFASFQGAENAFLYRSDRRLGISEYLTKESLYKKMADIFWTLISELDQPSVAPRYFLEKTPHHGLQSKVQLISQLL